MPGQSDERQKYAALLVLDPESNAELAASPAGPPGHDAQRPGSVREAAPSSSSRRSCKATWVALVACGAAACWLLYRVAHPLKAPPAGDLHAVSLSDLPDGWLKYVDKQGQTFYHHVPSGKSQWVRPEKEEWNRPEAWTPAYAAHHDLPKGWTKLVDGHGRTYYENLATHETQWERPDDEAVDAASCAYTRQVATAIRGNDVELSEGQTAQSCKELCTAKQSCLAVEYATTRSAGTGPAVYAAGWCSLQSAGSGGEPATDGYLNLDLYVKGDCKGMPSGLQGGGGGGGGGAGSATPKSPAAPPPAPPAGGTAGTPVQAVASPPAALRLAKNLTTACAPPKVKDAFGKCVRPTGPALMTFYMYRSQDDKEYPLENVNMADLAGALWYLHREVVPTVPRKFGVTRILRYMVTMKNTADLYQATRKQFAPFVAFDSGSAPGRTEQWESQGFNVGCQLVDAKLYNYRDEDGQPGKWYSLPGPCPEERVDSKTPGCMTKWPGGACESAMVTGTRDCTYYTEYAGEILLDDLEGIDDYDSWWKPKNANGGEVPNGNIEYKHEVDKGVGMDFWNLRHSASACNERMAAVTKLFKKKYPDLPETLPDPPCY